MESCAAAGSFSWAVVEQDEPWLLGRHRGSLVDKSFRNDYTFFRRRASRAAPGCPASAQGETWVLARSDANGKEVTRMVVSSGRTRAQGAQR